MVAKRTARRRRGMSTPKLLMWLLLLLLLALIVRGVYVAKFKTKLPPSVMSNSWQEILASDKSDWPKMRDRDGVYELSYPRSLFAYLEKNIDVPLLGESRVKAQILSHRLYLSACATPSTKCLASTTDLAVEMVVENKNFNNLFSKLTTDLGSLPVITIDGHQGVQIREAGKIELLLPIDDAKTLVIIGDLMPASLPSGDSALSGQLSMEDKEHIFQEIVSTLNFRPTF